MDRAAIRDTVKIIHTGEASGQACIVGRGRPDRADAEVSRAYPLRPGHPCGRHERIRTGQQDDLVDGGRLRTGCARDRHRPVPSDVRRVQADEEVGRYAVITEFDSHMITDRAPGSSLLRSQSSDIDGLAEHRIRHYSTPIAGTSWKTQSPKVSSP